MERINKLTFEFAIISFSIFLTSFNYRIKENSCENQEQSIKNTSYIAQNKLNQVANIPDFDFYDEVGRWRRLSKKEGILSLGIRRPSSGRDETIYDINTGVITQSWNIMGLGYGKQVVEPLGDGRYPWRVLRVAQRFLEWREHEFTAYEPVYKTYRLSAEDCLKLEKAAHFLFGIRFDYPFIEHVPTLDTEILTNEEESFVWITTRALNATHAEVVYMIVQMSEAARSKYETTPQDSILEQKILHSFDGLLPNPKSVYDEENARKMLFDLNISPMKRISEGCFETRIKIGIKDKTLYYLLRATDDMGHTTTLGASLYDVFKRSL